MSKTTLCEVCRTGHNGEKCKESADVCRCELCHTYDQLNPCICDKCKGKFDSLSLIWLTTEDFQPKEGEVLTAEADLYDAVCEACYQTLLSHTSDPVMIVDEGVSGKCAVCGDPNATIENIKGEITCEACETKRTMETDKDKLITEIHNILSETDNGDEVIGNLEEAMEFFCSTWDKCEGFKHAIQLTLDDQADNHIEDLTIEDLQTLRDKLTK